MEEEVEEGFLAEGKEVEVTSDEDGFEGVWFIANIIELPKSNTPKGEALIQYKDLVSDDDGQTPLTEKVKLSFIRPVPPPPEDLSFEVNDVVDAFHLDGWWTGFVSKLSQQPNKYFVSFPDPPEEIEFPSSALRPHRKWVDGKWVKPSFSEVIELSSGCEEPTDLSCNTPNDDETPIQLESPDVLMCTSKKLELCSVSSSKNEMALSTGCEVTAKVKKVKRAEPEGDPAQLHPPKKLKDGTLASSLTSPESSTMVFPSETPIKEVPTTATVPGTDVVDEQLVVNIGKVHVTEEVEVVVSSDYQTPNTTKDSAATVQLESSDSAKGSCKKHCVSSKEIEMDLSTASEGTTNGKQVKQVTAGGDAALSHPSKNFGEVQRVYELKKKFDGGSLVESLVLPDSNLPSETPNKEVPAEATLPGTDEVGEQPIVETIEVYLRDEIETDLQKDNGTNQHQKEDAAKTGINSGEQPRDVLHISQSPPSGQSVATGVPDKMVSQECTAMKVESPVIYGLEGADCQGKEIVVAGNSSGILHENKEQSSLILCKELQSGLVHSVVTVENNSGNIPHQRRENLPEIIGQSSLLKSENEPRGEELPFVKSFPIWNTIESMEIFQVLPQSPHFHPLFKTNELLREGLAIGTMFTFASLLQRASKLTISDPRNLFTGILDVLADLEMLGFDVKAVRGRTTELLSMKDKHGHLQDQSKEVKVRFTQHSKELTQLNEEIEAAKRMVRELEAKQESKRSEIVPLQACANVSTQDIRSVEYEFESLASSPW